MTNEKLKTFDKRSKSLLPPINGIDVEPFDSVSSARHNQLGIFSPVHKVKPGGSLHSLKSGSQAHLSN